MLETHQGIYDAVCRAAERGEMCPTNRELSQLIGLSPPACSWILHRLAHTGYIEIITYAMSRQVTICATGKKTAEITNKTLHGLPGKRYVSKVNPEIVASSYRLDRPLRRRCQNQPRCKEIFRTSDIRDVVCPKCRAGSVAA